MTSFLCIQAIAELTHSRAFLGANVCRVLDIRLTEPAQRARGDDLFIPGYSPNSSWDAMSNNLPAWAQRHASHVGTTSHGGRLVIAYHVWEECGDKKLPFRSGLDAQRFLDILNLDRKFLWALARKTPMPLSKEQAASNLRKSARQVRRIIANWHRLLFPDAILHRDDTFMYRFIRSGYKHNFRFRCMLPRRDGILHGTCQKACSLL